MPNATRSREAHHLPRHAVCVTGLQRSYPEISRNLHFALSHLYSGWRHGGYELQADGGGGRAFKPRHAAAFDGGERGGGWSLGRAVAFFGVRPANDSWAAVRTELPPMQGESIQTPCGPQRPAWFTAFAKTHGQRIIYGHSFVQSLCDLRACHELVQAHEQRVGRLFLTISRLRLDLAWETPLTMPPVLLPNAVYVSRMNGKQGVNDKWAIGRRAPMGAYLDRVQFIETANRLYNRSGPAAATRASVSRDGMLHYECPANANNRAFVCHPRHIRGTGWQLQPEGRARRFLLSSESFLHWSLWRSNVSVGYEPTWMFCKFGNSINSTARICVPRMRKREHCGSLICQGGLTDCFCKNSTCALNAWYCQNVTSRQLAIDPSDTVRGPPIY